MGILQHRLFWAVLYLIAMLAVVGGLLVARGRAMQTFGTAEARAQWERWREDVRQLPPQTTPTQRRVPRSTEPPALVLMRDHFTACLSIAVILSTALFVTTMVVVRGALAPSPHRSAPH